MLLSSIPAVPPSTETISWVTQVITSYNGSEERHQTRIKPRMSYQVKLPLNTKSEVDQIKTNDSKVRDNLEFIVWHAPYLGENRLATRRGHPWYFELGDKIAHWQLDREAIITDSILGAGDIYPVRDAIVDGDLRYSIRRGGGAVDIKYNAQEALAPPENNSYPTINIEGITYEVLEIPTKSGFSQAIKQNQGYFDSVVGSYIGTTRWSRPKLQWSYTVEMFTPEDVLAWKQFLFRRVGRLNPVVIKDTDGRALIMRMATDVPSINYGLNYYTSTVRFTEVFV